MGSILSPKKLIIPERNIPFVFIHHFRLSCDWPERRGRSLCIGIPKRNSPFVIHSSLPAPVRLGQNPEVRRRWMYHVTGAAAMLRGPVGSGMASSSSSSSPPSSRPSSSSSLPSSSSSSSSSSSNWLSGVNVVLFMAYGSLVFVLLFIFVKRQIMRFAMKSRRGPHVPVGQHAPKGLKDEIELRLSRVQDIKYEPQLLAPDDARLLQLESPRSPCSYNYVYRMKALDAVRVSEIPFSAEGRHPKSLIGKNFRSYLVDLRNASTPFKGVRKSLLDTLLDGYDCARCGTGVSVGNGVGDQTFGKAEYLKYQEALFELAAIIKARGGGSQRQHQSAAKDLTQSPDLSGPTIQVTYLPSSQKSKRPKHFLELKSFKDNYNTLESTL